MPATAADLDQLDAILDRLDDYAVDETCEILLDPLLDDLHAWYLRMFRPAPPIAGPADDLATWYGPLIGTAPATAASTSPRADFARLIGCIRRTARRLASRTPVDPMVLNLLAMAEDGFIIVAAVQAGKGA